MAGLSHSCVRSKNMTEYTYNQTIEYIDGTRDLNFEAAQRWSQEHGTSFEEDVTARKMLGNKLMRFFVIGDEPKPYIPTDDELKAQIRAVRDSYMQTTQNRIDRYRNQKELGIETTDTEEVFKRLLEYTQYLRDYPNGKNWWVKNPMVFDAWVVSTSNSII